CIGSDCRTSWPSSSSYSAGPGISISGATISNTGVVSESDPTVQSWAKISTGSAWVGYKWVPNGAQISCSPDGQGGQYATAYLRNNNGTLEIRGVVSGPEPRMSCDTGWVTGFHAYCLSTLGGWSIDAAENTPVQSLNSNLQYIHSLGAATLIGNGGTCFVDW
ncbi:MAG: hypothetical protein KGH56_02120, partial [Patescibacteria group bacterium]|nr:hypothetical protein [Patescibacteria group bacterium]